MNTYELLRAAGHSAPKAMEIAIDYKRGDDHARRWVEALRRTIPRTQTPGVCNDH